MSAPFSLAWLTTRAGRLNCMPVRAIVRAGFGSLPVGAFGGVLSDLSNAVGNQRMLDIGIAMASVGIFVWLMHWIGGRGGLTAGLKLTGLSWLYLQGLEAGSYALWVAAGMNGEPDWGFVAFLTATTLVLVVPTSVALKRLDG